MKRFFALIATFFIFAGQAYAVDTFTTEQKLADLDQLVSIVKSGYGPLVYKKEKLKIDVDALRTRYAEIVTNTKSNREFYYSLMRFIAEFHDGHFRATLPTDLMASVPFDTDLVEGKVLVDQINRGLLPESTFPFIKGDEVVAVDGTPIADVLKDLASYRGLGFDQSERRYAAMAVTVRDGKRMPIPVADTKVVFSIRRGTSQLVQEAALKWTVTGTVLDEMPPIGPFLGARPFAPANRFDLDTLSTFDLMKEVENPNLERLFRCSGNTRIEIPKDAKVLIRSPFVAYTWPSAKGQLGYLRIPHYSPEDGDYEGRLAQYEYVVGQLEKETVGLVIDQDHNCGGSVEYLHQIVSLFMSTQFPAMKFELLANKQELLKYESWLKETRENTQNRVNVERIKNLVKEAFLGRKFMTEKTAIDGQETRDPNTIRYTKPIVILIDEMSGSGGDAFPAMMKGLGRAELIGTRTMGLGGHVTDQAELNYSRIKPQMTKSLFYRPDGVPVENNGAEPTHPYSITREDFMYGYQNYRAFYTEKLLALIK